MTAPRERSASENDDLSGGPARFRRRARLAGGIAGGLLLVVVLPLALLVAPPDPWAPLQRLDERVTTGLHDLALAEPTVNAVAAVVTHAGTSWFRWLVLAPVFAWLLLRRSWRRAAFVGVAAYAIGPVTSGLKELVGRSRPEVSDPGETLQSLSYPSGHSSGITVAVVVLVVLAWAALSSRGRWIAAGSGTVVVALVALTRLLLGVHYLSDVVAGVSLGVAWVTALAVLFGVFGSGVPDRQPEEYGRTYVR